MFFLYKTVCTFVVVRCGAGCNCLRLKFSDDEGATLTDLSPPTLYIVQRLRDGEEEGAADDAVHEAQAGAGGGSAAQGNGGAGEARGRENQGRGETAQEGGGKGQTAVNPGEVQDQEGHGGSRERGIIISLAGHCGVGNTIVIYSIAFSCVNLKWELD